MLLALGRACFEPPPPHFSWRPWQQSGATTAEFPHKLHIPPN